jgi:hypothetical protein
MITGKNTNTQSGKHFQTKSQLNKTLNSIQRLTLPINVIPS